MCVWCIDLVPSSAHGRARKGGAGTNIRCVAATRESKCHTVSCSHVHLLIRRPDVHLRGRKAKTRHVQGPEPPQPNVSRDSRAFEGVVLSPRHGSFPQRRIGNLKILPGLLSGRYSCCSTVELSSVGVGIQYQKGVCDYSRPTKLVVAKILSGSGLG